MLRRGLSMRSIALDRTRPEHIAGEPSALDKDAGKPASTKGLPMTSKPSRATAVTAQDKVAAEQRADDLKQIHGIGPAAEQRLRQAGIRTLAQIAALSPDRLAALSPGLSSRRIAQENWIGQARRLAHVQVRNPARKRAARKRSTKPRKRATPRIERQHYATFTVELLLDESDDVRRTRCAHVQSGARDTWAGWIEARLVSFVVEHAGLRVPGLSVPTSPSQPEAALTTTATVRPIPPPTPEAIPAFAQAPKMETRSEEPEAESTCLVQGTKQELRGGLRLLDLAAMAPDSDQPCRVLPASKPFRVRLSLDLTGVARPPDVPLDCTTSIYAKRLGGDLRQLIGDARNAIKPSNKVTVQVFGLTLPPGLYRLEAVVRINLPALGSQAPAGLTAMSSGSLLQIY